MALKALVFKPGIDRENTRYFTEGGWYECDKVRFNHGSPEKIGGWQAVSNDTILGVIRSLFPWTSLASNKYLGLGTNLKYYILSGTTYHDITPIRSSVVLTNPFTTTNGSAIVLVDDIAHGAKTGDFVTFSGADVVGGLDLNGEYQITIIDADSYNITAASNATADATGGGAAVTADYQINTGGAIEVPAVGWGAGGWGSGGWGIGGGSVVKIRIWNAANFGEDLIFGPSGGPIYYWDKTGGLSARGVLLSSLGGATDVPVVHNYLLVSDISRYVFVFGTNEIGSSVLDPLLIRWSNQEDAVDWSVGATKTAGDIRLSHGSMIMARSQTRQEILVWTDTSLYSLQFIGGDIVWGANLLGEGFTIASDRAWAQASGVTYWMGAKQFYAYDGRVNYLPSDLASYVFDDFNYSQIGQVFATTVERFDEVWWFYCSNGSDTIDRYVVYNHAEKVWYYGNLARTAMIDSSLLAVNPIAATYNGRTVYHEIGTDDYETPTPAAIEAYILSSDFDLDDGDHFAFIRRIMPDVSFQNSSAPSPTVALTLYPKKNAGSGITNPASVGGSNTGDVIRSATVPVEAFTGQVNVRVRGRHMAFKIASSDVGVAWRLGKPRIDVRVDGQNG